MENKSNDEKQSQDDSSGESSKQGNQIRSPKYDKQQIEISPQNKNEIDKMNKTQNGFNNKNAMINNDISEQPKHSNTFKQSSNKVSHTMGQMELNKNVSQTSGANDTDNDYMRSKGSSKHSRKLKLHKKRMDTTRSSRDYSTSRDHHMSKRSKRSKKSKSNTPVLKFARTLDDFKTTFKDHESRLDGIDETLKQYQVDFDGINMYVQNNNEQMHDINEVIGIIQNKVGYFETKGMQHFRKHYLGPLTDLESLKKNL